MTFKKVNSNEKEFHYIELQSTVYVLFDSQFDIPIARGSKVIVGKEITKLNENVTVHYYKLDKNKIMYKMTHGQKK